MSCRQPTMTNASPASRMKAALIIPAVFGLFLIFAARRQEMPAMRTNMRMVGGALLAITLGFAAYLTIKEQGL